MKDKLSAHQETISILSKQKEAQIKLYKTPEDKELDKVIELENKVKVLDNIVYKTGQTVQTRNMLNNKFRTSFAKPEFLKKAQRANPRLYNIGCYNYNLALMLAPDSDKVIRLEKESRSKLSDLIRPFNYDKLKNLYDLFVPQREKSSEQRYFSERSRLSHINVNNRKSKEAFNKQTTLLEKRMDESIPLDKKCQSSIEIFKVKTPFNYAKLNSLYDLFVPQCEKSSEQRYFLERSRISHINVQNEKKKESFQKQTTCLEKRIDESIPVNKNCKSSIEIVNIKMNINTIITGVELCKQKITNRTYYGHIDPFIQKMIKQNFCPVIRRINVGLDLFLKRLNEEMVIDLRYFNSLEPEVDSLTSQLETQKTQFVNEIDRLSREYYYADHMNTILGVYTELDEVTNLQCDYLELLQKCECLETELSKRKMMKDFSMSKSVTKNNVSDDFLKPITVQTLPPNKKPILKNTNVLAPRMYKLHTEPTQTRTSQLPNDSRKTNKRVSFSTRVIPITSVSRPQLKNNPMEDRVLLSNSKGKKHEVDDHHRNVKFSNNKTFVTTCNDSSKAKTSNVNFVCATCGKCVLNEKHDMYVLKSVNSVNSRTEIPIVVPVSTREPKRTVKQSVAKPLRKT
nr:hypothetical protein [Tanacetum cinerariifolium]